MHCALRSVRCRPCVRKQGFKVCHWPLLRVDAPVWAKVHAASAKSGGCGIDESRPQGGGNKVRRTALLMLGLMAAVLVLASGVALAKDFVGTENGEKIVGTKFADRINALGATTWCLAIGVPTRYAVVMTTISNTVVGATTSF